MLKRQKKYFIKTFGCAANVADSQRIAAYYKEQGFVKAANVKSADQLVINTCIVRQSAEDRIYGLMNNLTKLNQARKKKGKQGPKVILTGCMLGMMIRDKSGKMMQFFKKKLPAVDEFLAIEEIGFDTKPAREDKRHALVPISAGCDNFCSFCVVPFTRGREVSRSFADIISECQNLAKQGYTYLTLVGQNVNSYGKDLIKSSKLKAQSSKLNSGYRLPNGRVVRPIMVKHLGRYRIPTLFPYLLEEICKIKGIEKIDFISSNPWDFSDELIDVIAKNQKISRQIHLPVQSGDDKILKKMSRWYTSVQYLELISKIKNKIKDVKLTTDIIVGFPHETEEQFQNTLALCKKVGFEKAYIAMYSQRPMTAAAKILEDDVPHKEKKRRWQILENFINAKWSKR